jgi:rubrerythrin
MKHLPNGEKKNKSSLILWKRKKHKNYKGGKEMLSQIPLDLSRTKKEDIKREILRAGIIAELDAINLYEQMAALTTNENIRKVLLDIAKEEKTHVGEFLALLIKEDKEQEGELEEGRKELKEITGE